MKDNGLCEKCPISSECNGFCETLEIWESGNISLEQAVKTKEIQNKRHEETDPLRKWLHERVSSELEDVNHKKLEGFAAEVAKGVNPFVARHEHFLDIPDELCREIKEEQGKYKTSWHWELAKLRRRETDRKDKGGRRK